MHRSIFTVIVTAIVSLISIQALAGSFRAVPLRLHLGNDVKTEVLKIINEENGPVTLQLDVKSWSHDVNGEDQYGDTSDILVFPKIATIEGGGTQIFRIGYSGMPVTTERSFRVFVQELPVNNPGEPALKFALTLGLPVFVEPQSKQLVWTAQVLGMKQETLQVKVENSGNSHLMVNKIKAIGLDTEYKEVFTEEIGGWYTLAGKARNYVVPVSYQQCLQAAKINIEIEAKDANKILQMPVERSMCSQKPETKGGKEKANHQSTAKQ